MRLTTEFLSMVLRDLSEHSNINKKYNVADGKSEIGAGIRFGYTSKKTGLGWIHSSCVLLWDELPDESRKVFEAKCISR